MSEYIVHQSLAKEIQVRHPGMSIAAGFIAVSAPTAVKSGARTFGEAAAARPADRTDRTTVPAAMITVGKDDTVLALIKSLPDAGWLKQSPAHPSGAWVVPVSIETMPRIQSVVDAIGKHHANLALTPTPQAAGMTFEQPNSVTANLPAAIQSQADEALLAKAQDVVKFSFTKDDITAPCSRALAVCLDGLSICGFFLLPCDCWPVLDEPFEDQKRRQLE